MTEGTLEEIKAGLVRTQLESTVGEQAIDGIKAGLAQAQVVLANTSPLPASAHSTPVRNSPPSGGMSAGRSESPLAGLREQHKAQLLAEEALRSAAIVPPSTVTLEDLIPLVEQKQ